MSISDTVGPERTSLNFADLVARRFTFLRDRGFAETEALPTIVRYRRGDLELSIYHGRRSFEAGFQIGHTDESYAMSKIIRATDPEAADRYRNAVAKTVPELATAVDRLAEVSFNPTRCAAAVYGRQRSRAGGCNPVSQQQDRRGLASLGQVKLIAARE
jgi:hypothetical protein